MTPRARAGTAIRAIRAMLATTLLALLMLLVPDSTQAQSPELDAFRQAVETADSNNPTTIMLAFTRLAADEQAVARDALRKAHDDAVAAGDEARASMLGLVLTVLPAPEATGAGSDGSDRTGGTARHGGVAGILVDAATGAPLKSATVQLIPAGADSLAARAARTDAEGRFSFADVPAGEARLVVDPFAQGAGYYAANGNKLFERLEIPLEISAGETASPTVALPTAGAKAIERSATIKGTIRDLVSGAPIAGAQVFVGRRSATSGPDGGFRVREIRTGRRMLIAEHPDYLEFRRDLGTLEPGIRETEILMQPAGTGNFEGQVLAADSGRPLAGALVVVGNREAMTDEQGRFRLLGLAAGDLSLSASAERHKPASLTLSLAEGETASRTIRLEPVTTGRIAGLVLDAETGQPLPGAVVFIGDERLQAGADGAFRSGELAEGEVLLTAQHAGYRPAKMPLRVFAGEEVGAVLELAPITTGSLALTVLDDETGQPLEGAVVRIADREARSDAQGRARFDDLPAGAHSVAADHPGHVPGAADIRIRRAAETAAELRLKPILTGDVVGRVVNARDGSPVPGAAIAGPQVGAVADEGGRFRLPGLMAGRIRLSASAPLFAPAELSFDLARNDIADVTIELEPITHGAVRGRVVDDATGEPLAGARVRIGGAEVSTDAAGAFAFERIGIGDILAEASQEGYLPGHQAARLEPGRDLELTIRLEREPLGALSGRIVDSRTGEPIAGALVTAGGQTAETDAEGNYRFEGLKAGAAEIEVRYPGYRAQVSAGAVVPGEGGRLDVTLAKREETAGEIGAALSDSGAIDLYGIHFDVNKDQFTPQSLPTLHALKAYLDAHPGEAFILEGHTDSDGSEALNQDLSERRAATVLRWLADSGTDISNIRAVGMGETAPVASNATRAGKALNRRVVLRRADGREIPGAPGGN